MAFHFWIIVILGLVALLAVLLRFLEGAARTGISLALAAVVLGGGTWMMYDVYDLHNHFYQDEKLFVLDIDGRLVAAFRLAGDGQPKIMDDLSTLRARYPDLGAIRGDAYKVIALTWPVVAKDASIEGFAASEEEIKDALLTGRPKDLFITKGVAKLGEQARGKVKLEADRLYPTHDAFASTLFAFLAEQPLNDPNFMFMNYKEGTVVVYPETVTFKMLKVLPNSINKIIFPTQR